MGGTKSTKPDSLTERVLGVVDGGQAIAAGAAGLLYVAVRWVYASVYGQFGVSPEEVGHDRTSVLTHAITGLVLVLTACAAVVGGCLALLRRARRTLERAGSGREASRSPLIGASHLQMTVFACYLALPVLVVAAIAIDPALRDDDLVYVAVLLAFVPPAVAAVLAARRVPVAFGALPVLLYLVAVSGFVLDRWTEVQTRRIERSAVAAAPTDVHPPSLIGLVFDISATPVCVRTSNGATLPSNDQRPLLYLGQSGGNAVFLRRAGADPDHAVVVRLPSADLAIEATVPSTLASCPAP